MADAGAGGSRFEGLAFEAADRAAHRGRLLAPTGLLAALPERLLVDIIYALDYDMESLLAARSVGKFMLGPSSVLAEMKVELMKRERKEAFFKDLNWQENFTNEEINRFFEIILGPETGERTSVLSSFSTAWVPGTFTGVKMAEAALPPKPPSFAAGDRCSGLILKALQGSAAAAAAASPRSYELTLLQAREITKTQSVTSHEVHTAVMSGEIAAKRWIFEPNTADFPGNPYKLVGTSEGVENNTFDAKVSHHGGTPVPAAGQEFKMDFQFGRHTGAARYLAGAKVPPVVRLVVSNFATYPISPRLRLWHGDLKLDLQFMGDWTIRGKIEITPEHGQVQILTFGEGNSLSPRAMKRFLDGGDLCFKFVRNPLGVPKVFAPDSRKPRR